MSTKFYSLTVQDIRQETNDTVSIAFAVPPGLVQEFKFKAGQYLTLKKMLNGEDVRRSYSICSAPSENELRVAVKRIDKGVFSGFATQTLKKGDQLEVMSPTGNFAVIPDRGAQKNYVFFAAGSGITPVISMVRTIVENEKNSTVYLYYSNKTNQDIIFKSQLDALAAANTNLKLNYLLTREESGSPLMNGRVDKGKCEAIFGAHLSSISIDGVYACGPQEMIFSVRDFFTSKGLPAGKIHFELFTVTAPAETKPAGVAVDAKVTVIIDDEPYSFSLNGNGKSILQAAQEAGADVPFSCKGGVCCTCKAKVMEGKVRMDLNYALEPDEVEEGFILTCQSHPTTEKVVVSFDEY